MRKVVGTSLAAFTTLVAGAALSAPPVEATTAPRPQTELEIIKTIPEVVGQPLPTEWTFTIESLTCGDAITPPLGGAKTTPVVVTIPGGGGSVTVTVDRVDDVNVGCQYRITESPVENWVPANPPGGVADITLTPNDRERAVTFANRDVPPTTTTTTTTTVLETTTTTVPETTSTTTQATSPPPTTLPPTTMGTIAPELPPTGASNTLATLLAGLLVVGGVAAIVASRRAA